MSEAKPAFCTNCGKPINDGAKFCTSCGTAVSGKSAKTETQNQVPQKAGRKKSFGLKLILIAAVIVLASAFVFFYFGGGGGLLPIGVGGGGGGGGGVGGKPSGSYNSNKGVSGLTITGLPSGQWLAQIHAAGTDISKAGLSNFGKGKSGKEMITAKEATGGNNPKSNPNVLILANLAAPHGLWTGSGKREVMLSSISEVSDKVNPVLYRYATVNFSNGRATVPFSSFKPVTIGGQKSGKPK